MLYTQALITGLIISAILTGMIFSSLWFNPRLWIGDLPEDVRKQLPPLSESEKRQRGLFAYPPILFALAFPIWQAWQYEQINGALSFLDAFLFVYIAWMIFNLVDLVLIDWLVIVWWQPKRFVIPGTEGLMTFNTYGHHFRGFLKGTVGLAIWSLISAGILMLI